MAYVKINISSFIKLPVNYRLTLLRILFYLFVQHIGYIKLNRLLKKSMTNLLEYKQLFNRYFLGKYVMINSIMVKIKLKLLCWWVFAKAGIKLCYTLVFTPELFTPDPNLLLSVLVYSNMDIFNVQ
jgi:hypothetical protein